MSSRHRALAGIHSVFFRLILSYVVLVVLMALTIAGVAFLYFQSKYNQELENFHQLYLKDLEQALDTQILDTSKTLYLEVANLLDQASGDILSPGDPAPSRPAKIYQTFQTLSFLVARNYQLLESASLYYVNENLLVTSSGFVAGESPRPEDNGYQRWQDLRARELNSRWTLIDRPAYLGIQSMTLFRFNRCFPILSSPEDCSVIISLDFRADSLRQSMARLLPAEGGLTGLIDPGTPQVLMAGENLAWKPAVDQRLRAIIARAASQLVTESLVVDSQDHLLTVMPFGDSGWYLSNVVTSTQLYQRGEGIRFVLVIICLCAIVLGILVSSLLTYRIYNPLERLVTRFRTLFGLSGPETVEPKDEYQVIDSALDGISSRMDELQATIDTNRPVMKNELVLRALEGERVEPDEWQDTWSLLGLPAWPSRVRAALATLPHEPQNPGLEGGTTRRVLKYQIADEMESVHPGRLLACPLPGNQVGFLLESAHDGSDLEPWESMVDNLRNRFGSVVLAFGPPVDSPSRWAASFSVAKTLSEFHFLFPERNVLVERPDLLARSGPSALPDKEFLPAVASALQAKNLPRFQALLDRFREAARQGSCSVASCRADLGRINQVVADHARDLRMASPTPLDLSLRDLLAEADSLDAFLAELTTVAEDLCSVDGPPRSQRNTLLCDRIKAHIVKNLSSDLSLERVGAALAVSPGYMSKIFKDETGRNFVSYVTEVRLAEAARLLSESREPIQEIGHRVGIHTPAYFIRLFRGRYGQTPLDYRRNHPAALS